MSKLSTFRNSPESVVEGTDFALDARGAATTNLPVVTNCEYGGPVTISEGKSENGVVRLTLKTGGSDYFFPWVNRGVGEVNVPKLAPDGTIVITGGMNGCSLEVRENGPHLVFYHDADSNRLGTLKAPVGNLLCRVGPRDYMPLNLGQKTMEDSPKDGTAYFHQMMAVKNGGKWKVFSFDILVGPGIEMPIKGGFRGTITKLMATF